MFLVMPTPTSAVDIVNKDKNELKYFAKYHNILFIIDCAYYFLYLSVSMYIVHINFVTFLDIFKVFDLR